MKTITYKDEVASWRRRNHLMGNKLLPSSYDMTVIASAPEPLSKP
jgi:hypothetical protein